MEKTKYLITLLVVASLVVPAASLYAMDSQDGEEVKEAAQDAALAVNAVQQDVGVRALGFGDMMDALRKATKEKNDEMFKMILRCHPGIVGLVGPTGYSELMHVAEMGYVGGVRMLLDAGAAVDAADKGGRTVLMLAVQEGHAEVVRELVDRGAGVGKEDAKGRTALMYAVRRGHATVIEALCSQPEIVDRASGDQQVTALMFAAAYGYGNGLKALIDNGANVNAVDKGSQTALMYRARSWTGFNACADCDKHVWTCGDCGIGGACYECEDNFLACKNCNSADSDTPDGIAELLCDRGADINRIDSDGYTALMVAAENGKTTVMQSLLDRGARTDIQNTLAETALMMAIGEDYDVNAELLIKYGLKYGFNVDMIDGNGDTALMRAVKQWSYRPLNNVVMSLLHAGAQIDRPDKDGFTVLKRAINNKDSELIKLLILAGANFNFIDASDDNLLLIAQKIGMAEPLLQAARQKNGLRVIREAVATGPAEIVGDIWAAMPSAIREIAGQYFLSPVGQEQRMRAAAKRKRVRDEDISGATAMSVDDSEDEAEGESTDGESGFKRRRS